MSPSLPQVAFVTDMGLLRPSLLAMWSLLRHVSVPVQVHFWGARIGDEGWQAVERVAQSDPRCQLVPRELDADVLEGANTPAAHISPATLGRLFLPRHLSGRVLYIDGDTLIARDTATLFGIDLEGHELGAVRDFVVSNWMSRQESLRPHQSERLARLAEHMDPAHYFNSGVLLLDCDAIRARAQLIDRLEDVAAASAAEWGDQDHLNVLFAGHTRLLNPAFNSSWGRTRRQRRFAKTLGGNGDELLPQSDVIVHYHGPKKPWKNARFDFWSQRARSVMRYRHVMGQFVRLFPDLAP